MFAEKLVIFLIIFLYLSDDSWKIEAGYTFWIWISCFTAPFLFPLSSPLFLSLWCCHLDMIVCCFLRWTKCIFSCSSLNLFSIPFPSWFLREILECFYKWIIGTNYEIPYFHPAKGKTLDLPSSYCISFLPFLFFVFFFFWLLFPFKKNIFNNL